MSSIKKRMLEYILNDGISKYKFYNETGMTRGVLDSPSGITEDNIIKFVNYYPDIDLNWLIKGEKDNSSKLNKSETYHPDDNVSMHIKSKENIKDEIIRLLTVDDEIQKAFKYIIGKEINTFASQKLLDLIQDEKLYEVISVYLKGTKEKNNTSSS